MTWNRTPGTPTPFAPKVGQGRLGKVKDGEARATSSLNVRASALADTIGKVIAAGGAITIGSTRDGGALMLRLHLNGGADTGYATSPEELEELLADVNDRSEAALVRVRPLVTLDAKKRA